MKKLILIVGPNGVGKSTTAKILVSMIQKSALVDSDWCRVINPFAFTKATKKLNEDNIYCMLHNYLLCEDVQTVIFTYSFHGGRQEIWNNVWNRLQNDTVAFTLHPVILKCEWEENIRRAREDGRDEVRIERGMRDTFSYYDGFSWQMIETTKLIPKEVARKIIEMTNGEEV